MKLIRGDEHGIKDAEMFETTLRIGETDVVMLRRTEYDVPQTHGRPAQRIRTAHFGLWNVSVKFRLALPKRGANEDTSFSLWLGMRYIEIVTR